MNKFNFKNFKKDFNNISKDFLKISNAKSLTKNHYYNGIKLQHNSLVNIYINFLNFKYIKQYLSKDFDNKNILDLGCGIGDKSIFLRKFFPKANIYGLETINHDDLEHKEYPPNLFFNKFYSYFNKKYNLNLSLYNGSNLNFKNNFFDIIMLYAVIEHIDPKKRKKLIEEISLKLKKGGFIVITRCPRYYSILEFISRKLNLGAHQWVLKKRDLTNLFDKKKFSIKKIKTMNNIPTSPTNFTNSIFPFLILVDKFLSIIKWPFATDYFLIVKKK